MSLDFSLPKSSEIDIKYMIRFGWANHSPFVSAERFSMRIRHEEIDVLDYDANKEGAREVLSICEIGSETKAVGMYKAAKKGVPFSSLLSDPYFEMRYIHRIVEWLGLVMEQKEKPIPFPFQFSPIKAEHSAHITFLLSMCGVVRQLFVGNFEPIPIRESVKATGIDRLSEKGENLALVAKKIRENNPREFESAVSALRRFVPEIKTVEPTISEDGYAFLRFIDRNFDRPFNSLAMSDGTVLAFAYLLLLVEAKEKLVCIDEIERSLYPGISRHLLVEMRKYAQIGSGQVMVSTHSPDLLNYAELDEVFWLAKKDGCTQIHRAKEDEEVSAFVENGDLPGWVWRKGLFAGADPESEVE